MSFVPLSSFDPLFFMHHAAMDRFIAMWQVLNPNAWIIPMEAMETSYTTNKGTIHTSRTPLTPFYISENGTFWDSDMARSTITFGYAYAETDPSIVARTELHAEYLRRSIGAWYSDSRSKALQDTGDEFKSAFRQSWTNGTPCSLRDCKPNITEDAKDPPRRAIIKESSWREEWTIGVIVNANALERPYIIHFYLGKMPSTCRHSGGPNSIGSLSFMSMRMPGDVGDTGEEHKYKQAASTPITSALVKLVEVGYIKNLDANAVEPLLREALHFQICTYASAENTYSYTKVDPRSVGGLYIRITSTNRTVMQSDNKVRQWEPRVTRLNLFGSFPG